MQYKINRSNPLPAMDSNYLPWQIVSKEGVICEFRGPMSLMCCMAALERMNDPNYSMEQAQNIYEKDYDDSRRTRK